MRESLLSCCLVFALAGASDVGAQPGQGPPAEELSSIAAAWFALDLSPGMAIAAVQDGEVIYAEGFGVADIETGRAVTADTAFYIASTTKSFTAFLVTLLDRRGDLDMDAPVSRYLPDLRFGEGLSADEITLRDLIALRHGIEDGGPVVYRTAYTGEHTAQGLLELLSGYGPGRQGRAFHYGNLGYNITGLALDAAFDASWQELLEHEVFSPAGMSATTSRISAIEIDHLAMPHRPTAASFERVPQGKVDATMHAAGGHVSTVGDLARWLTVHLDGGRLGGRAVFPPEVVAETHRLQVEQDRTFGPYHRHGWGLGWDLGTHEGELLVHRFGSFTGYRSHVSMLPGRGLGVVVLVNDGTIGGFLADQVANALYDRLMLRPDATSRRENGLAGMKAMAAQGRQQFAAELERRRQRSQELPHPLAAYTGVFVNPAWGTLLLRESGGGLEAAMGAARSPVEVFDATKNQLRVELFGSGNVAEVRFEDDRAVEVLLLDNRFRRQESPGD